MSETIMAFLTTVLSIVINVGRFIVVLGVLVFIHELGHYLAAKWSGVRIPEFALGFGPSLFRFRMGETTYAIRIIPLGGYVRLAGMEPPEPGDEAEADAEEDDERSFYRQPKRNRFMILAAGPIMNLLLAVAIYAFLLSGSVVTIHNVFADSPAAEAGLMAEDRLVSIDGTPIISLQDLIDGVQKDGGEGVQIVVNRDGQRHSIAVKPRLDQQSQALVLGVELKQGRGDQRRPFFESVAVGFRQTGHMMTELVRNLRDMASGRAAAELAGPVGIYKMTETFAEGGILPLMSLVAILSISLGVFNLLPIPILDGGHLLFIVLEAIRGQPLKPEHKGVAQLVGLSLLLLLLLFATFQDISRLRHERLEQSSVQWQVPYRLTTHPAPPDLPFS